jgi:lipopolysaccharide/colanic/teichoic acid biosynthesis glycosyltransferase
MKRLFDIIFSSLAIMISFPILLLASIIIKIDNPSESIIFKQKRAGKNKVYFKIYKFKTMNSNSEKNGEITIGNDSRITKPGKWIRKFKIDELPQFFNVLKGEMSVVGPRPEVQKYIELYDEKQLKVLGVKPGITDYASIVYFDENQLLGESEDPNKTYVEVIMPNKLKLNLKYIEEKSLLVDLKIIFSTIMKVIK